jgi:hypothetical protein
VVLDDYAASCIEKKPDRGGLTHSVGALLPFLVCGSALAMLEAILRLQSRYERVAVLPMLISATLVLGSVPVLLAVGHGRPFEGEGLLL